MTAMIVTKAIISLSNIVVSCKGVPTGTKIAGEYYEPFNQGLNVRSAGCTSEDSSGLTNVICTADTSEEDFKVVKRTYNKDGKEISSETKCEKKRITMNFTFFINDSGTEPEIRLMSCELS